MGGWGGGSEEPAGKVEDEFAYQTMVTAELLPDHLTSGPRTGGVFKTLLFILAV